LGKGFSERLTWLGFLRLSARRLEVVDLALDFTPVLDFDVVSGDFDLDWDARIDLVLPEALPESDLDRPAETLREERFDFRLDLTVLDSAEDFRLSRRWTFRISSTKSSFFMPCQPGTP
jgi:hypothetical protein